MRAAAACSWRATTAVEQAVRFPPPSQWQGSCFCWPQSDPCLHMAYVPVQKTSHRRWGWKVPEGKVFEEPCEQTASELLADLRLRDSATPRLHVPPPSPSVTTYKLSLPSPEAALFFLLQLQTTAFKTLPCSFESSVPTFQHHLPAPPSSIPSFSPLGIPSGLLAIPIVGVVFPVQGRRDSSELLETPPSALPKA